MRVIQLVSVLSLALAVGGCIRPAWVRQMMSDAQDLPCLVDDVARPIEAASVTSLGFAPLDVEAALGVEVAPELTRRPPNRAAYEWFDPDHGFRPTARLVDITFDPEAWELVTRPAAQAENGSRGFMSRRSAPNGGPRPNFTCLTGQIVRGWATATAVFDHDDYGELTWDVAGWVEAQSAERDELVFLLSDWKKKFWTMPRRWRDALKDEAGRGVMCPTQAQVVMEGQVGWGGWFSVHVARDDCPVGGSPAADPLVDFRWFDLDYEP